MKRGLVVLLLCVPVAFTPLGDELTIVPSERCAQPQAVECLANFKACRALRYTPPDAPAAARLIVSNRCFAEGAILCNQCWPPVVMECRGFWDRLLVIGPWWMKLLPGDASWWRRLHGQKGACELKRIEMQGV